jgi:Flp pilus assembly protein TadD
MRTGCAFGLIAFLACVGLVQSQTGGSTTGTAPANGSVIVYVVGSDGNRVNRAFDVTITRAGILFTDHYQTTDQSGMTQFAQLQFAEYQVTASAPGYKEGGATVDVTAVRNPAVISVTVEPTSDNSSTPPDEKGITLAPKAKKEAVAGISALQAGRYDEAEQHLLAAYKLAPGNPAVNDMLGELYITTKDYDKAEAYLLRAASIEPDDPAAQTNLGYLHVQRKDYTAAQMNLERAVILTPQNWYSHWLLGIAYLNLRQPEKAGDQAAAAVQAGKGQAPDAQYLLGEALALQGRGADAIKALDQLLKDAPDYSNAPASAPAASASAPAVTEAP